MAFKIGNKVVLSDADPSATLLANSNLDKLQINGTDVLIHDGTTATLVEESAIATGSMLGDVTAAVSGSNVIIYINMGSSSSATITHIIDKITV